MATAAQVTAQARTQAALVDAARVELNTFWRALNFGAGFDPIANRDALLEFMPALVRKYGNAAGVAAADFYDGLRADAVTTRAFKAIIADANDEAVTAATRRLAGALFGDSPESMLAGLGAVVDKQVKQVARDTIQGSARQDPGRPLYARIPRGDTCTWCLKLASRGFIYASAEEAGSEGNTYHHDCDCVPTPEWSKSPTVDGYDVEALYQQYLEQDAADRETRIEPRLAGARRSRT